MSLKAKLNRMKSHLTREAPAVAAESESLQFRSHTELTFPFADQWSALQARPYGEADSYIIVREVRYPLQHRHGAYAFAQLHEVIASWEQAGLEHPLSSARRSAEDLLFFDTETTGLHGGSGNTIFLLGHSRLEGEEVVVRQHFLPAPHAEATLYQAFLAEATADKHLVTFNGKSFDWPQVKTRHTMVRDAVPQLPAFGHFDLLHGARRLWKQELEACRLSIIEEEKLGVTRTDDVPGYLAPMLYFQYVQSQNPEIIQGVLQHNEQDVLSLITLYIHLSRLILEHERDAVTHEERFEIARWYEALGEEEQARLRYREIARSDHALRGKARIALAHVYKRQKQWERALAIYEGYIREFSHVPEEVYVEAAKICEHHQKDYEKALAYTLQAVEVWKRKGTLLRHRSKAEQEAYTKRIERLTNRLQRDSEASSRS